MAKRKVKQEHPKIDKDDSVSAPIDKINGSKIGKIYQYNDMEKKSLLVELIRNGRSLKDAAEIVGIKTNTAKTIMYRYRVNGGKLIIKNRGGGKATKLNTAVLNSIADIIKNNPKITFNGIREKLFCTQQIKLSMGSIKNAIDKIKRNYTEYDNEKNSKVEASVDIVYNEPTLQYTSTQQTIADSSAIPTMSTKNEASSECIQSSPLINEDIHSMQYSTATCSNCRNRTELLLQQLVYEHKRTNTLLEKTVQLLFTE